MTSPLKTGSKRVRIRTIDWKELDRYVNELYKVPKSRAWSVVQDQELSNFQTIVVKVEGGTLERHEEEWIKEVKKGSTYSWLLSYILKDLCNRALLQPGEYEIHVSW